MRRVATGVIGLALAVLVVGLALLPLTQPFFTRALSARFSLAEEAGLPPQQMLDIAEQVRVFVVAPKGGTLPARVDGRPGFDAAAVSHLVDVARVLAGARLLTLALASALALWLGVQIARRRWADIVRVMRAGALWCIGLVLLAALAGLLDFEALFTAFHGLFFAEGTWTFASDSLLIQAFPEPFWAASAGAWAALVLLAGAALALGGWGLSAWSATSQGSASDASSANGA